MNPDFSDWDDDLPPKPEEVYQDLVRALKRKSGFGLYFVQCTPAEADRFIAKLPQDIPQKKVVALSLVEAIDNLYARVAEFVKDKQVNILLIKGLEYSLYKYEQRTFGEITEGQFSNLTRVPPVLNHLNQQRERFRDDFSICFVFLLRSFSINYLIHRAPDFFDWRSGVFELPTTPEIVEQESNRLLLEGDYEKYLQMSAEQKIEKVLEIQELLTEQHQTENGKANLLFELGNLLSAAKEDEAALASYDQALKIKPDYHLAWYNRGIALGNLGQYEQEIASYDQTLKIKPDYHLAWYGRSIALGNLGQYEQAIASYYQALKIKPDYHLAWYNRGIALGNLGQYEQAIASYYQALKIKPDYHLAWYGRGIALRNLGQYEQAIASYDQALKFKPDYHEAWYSRGIALGNLGQYEQEIASYDQTLKFKPDLHQAWNSRGIALHYLGRYEQAIASYDQALKFKPDLHQAWNSRGIALGNLGQYEQAIASYDQALKIKPDHDWAWNNRGIALGNLGQYQEAITSLDKALQIKSDLHKAWYARGNALYALDDYEEALASYNKVIELKPDYHLAWYYRAKALDELGLRKEASASYGKAQEIQQMKQHYSSQEEYKANQVNEYVLPTPHLLLPEAWQPSQPYKARGTFPEFLSSPGALRMYLKLEDASMVGSPVVTVQNKGRQDFVPQQSYLIELHPVFSHISFLLIQSLSETGHGEFITRSKQGKFEAIVELGGQVSQRYLLSKQELEEIQQIYDQILDTWIAWRLSQKKAYQSFSVLLLAVAQCSTEDILLNQSSFIELHPVFSHISFLLIQSLSETGQGEFITRCKQGKFEAIVELGGHVSQRYLLSKQELEEIQQMYDQILENWITWRQSRKNN